MEIDIQTIYVVKCPKSKKTQAMINCQLGCLHYKYRTTDDKIVCGYESGDDKINGN